jgi:hypothetical protein
MTPFVLIVALVSIAGSSLIMRIVIGYLLRPPGARVSFRKPLLDPRWVGRRIAELLYRRNRRK